MTKSPRFTSRIVETDNLPRHPGQIQPAWRLGADRNGYDIVARVIDKNHLLIRCRTCGGAHVSRYFVVAKAKPMCPHCLDTAWRQEAETAGVQFLRRDETDRKYGFYLAPCGHEQRLQRGRVQTMGAEGESYRCDICQASLEEAEAARRGWSVAGPDPEGNPSYRLYRHAQGCGCEVRIARANMQSGRFTCPGCGEGWATAPSFLYVMRFRLNDDRRVVKLGFSRDPDSRLHHQLLSGSPATGEILRHLPMPTGRAAQSAEKRLHRRIAQQAPTARVPAEVYAAQIHVASEIYTAETEPLILRLLDALAADLAA